MCFCVHVCGDCLRLLVCVCFCVGYVCVCVSLCYSPTIGRDKEPANYFGVPNADCGDLPDGEDFQDQNCLNAPPCV